jgi:hypothetical protein
MNRHSFYDPIMRRVNRHGGLPKNRVVWCTV